jgi:hypothetical protein
LAVINHPPDLPGMVHGASGGAPHAGYAELAASTVLVVVRAIHPAPGVGAPDFYFPAMLFSIPKSLLSFNETKRRLTQPPVWDVSFWPFNFLTQANYS